MAKNSSEDSDTLVASMPLVVDLDGYEGPLDALLALARRQQVDLTQISILELAEQYLAFIENARQLRLEIAADYLVMAAWLAYLKSRLLLPISQSDEGPSGQEMAARLAFQIRRLGAMRHAAEQLMGFNLLGRDVFARGAPEGVNTIRSNVYDVSLYDVLRAYADNKTKEKGSRLSIEPRALFSVDEALERLSSLVGHMPDWETLEQFLPSGIRNDHEHRAALATTLAATLEMTRSGSLLLRQSAPFSPIHVRRAKRDSDNGSDDG